MSIISCKKSNNGPSLNNNNFKSNGLTIIQNDKYTNANDTLQAAYIDSINNVIYYYYGSFDNTGTPLQIKHVAIKHSDTVLNMNFDDSLNVTSAYLLINNCLD